MNKRQVVIRHVRVHHQRAQHLVHVGAGIVVRPIVAREILLDGGPTAPRIVLGELTESKSIIGIVSSGEPRIRLDELLPTRDLRSRRRSAQIWRRPRLSSLFVVVSRQGPVPVAGWVADAVVVRTEIHRLARRLAVKSLSDHSLADDWTMPDEQHDYSFSQHGIRCWQERLDQLLSAHDVHVYNLMNDFEQESRVLVLDLLDDGLREFGGLLWFRKMKQ